MANIGNPVVRTERVGIHEVVPADAVISAESPPGDGEGEASTVGAGAR